MRLSSARISPLVLLIALAGAVAAVASYLQALNYPFIYDDIVYITENSKLAGLPVTGLWRLFIEPFNRYSEFLPLRELSYWFDMTLFGLNPAAFRVHNIILYLLCLPLVFSITSGLWKYFRPADAAFSTWVAAIVTALFAIHPSHVEAVVWISGRKDVLATVFSLLGIWLAMHARRDGGLSAPYAIAALLALLAALLAKASAFAVAPVIALLWFLYWRDTPQRRLGMLLWPLASLVLAAGVALVFAATITSKLPLYFGLEFFVRTFAILGWLTRLALSPESRHFFYPTFDDPSLALMVGLGVLTLAGAIAGAVMLLRKRWLLEGFATVVFLVLCIPSLQLIPYSPPSLVSDRWLAVAIWPAILLLVSLLWRMQRIPRMALLLGLVLLWGHQTWERPRDWRSFETMIDADIQAYPGYYMPALYKIFAIQLRQGLRGDALQTAAGIANPVYRDMMVGMVKADHAAHVSAVANSQVQEAMDMLWQLERELKQLPEQARWDPLIYHVWERRRIVLKSDWEYLARQFPNEVSVRYNTGLWMLSIHDPDAVLNLRAAVESQQLPAPLRGTAYRNLGLALMENGRFTEAEASLQMAIVQSPPDFRAYCLLAGVYRQAGNMVAASRAETECRGRVANQ